MKKFTLLILSAALTLALAGCGRDENRNSMSDISPTGGNYRLGLGSYTHADDSKGYSRGENGRDKVSTTVVAAIFDEDGKIVKISVDETEATLEFDGKGRLVNRKAGAIKSKKELGNDYNMRPSSPIGKEWYEQVATLEKWLVGKDINKVLNGGFAAVGSTEGSSEKNEIDSRMKNEGDVTNSEINSVNEAINEAESVPDRVTGGVGESVGNWKDSDWLDEEVRAGVTIDTKYVYKALQKAYDNAF